MGHPTRESPEADHDQRPLESQWSQAAATPLAQHGDALSSTQALADSVNARGSQRVGSSPPVANPVVSFPERREDDTENGPEPEQT